jgi:hypothetical protein
MCDEAFSPLGARLYWRRSCDNLRLPRRDPCNVSFMTTEIKTLRSSQSTILVGFVLFYRERLLNVYLQIKLYCCTEWFVWGEGGDSCLRNKQFIKISMSTANKQHRKYIVLNAWLNERHFLKFTIKSQRK